MKMLSSAIISSFVGNVNHFSDNTTIFIHMGMTLLNKRFIQLFKLKSLFSPKYRFMRLGQVKASDNAREL